MPGRLYLVATPIGNLADLSERATHTLQSVSFIACEDTRHSEKLLGQYNIQASRVSFPAFAEKSRTQPIIDRLLSGADGALITDAGTPGISDPGEFLVAEAISAGIRVEVIPGPCALIAALSASGLPTSRFHFLGFLPKEAGDARAMIEEVVTLRATLVLYEAANRVSKTVALLLSLLGDRRACIARELTKVHEEFLRGKLSELKDVEVMGEVVIVVEGHTGSTRWSHDDVVKALREGLAQGERVKMLSQEVAAKSGWSANELYRMALQLKG